MRGNPSDAILLAATVGILALGALGTALAPAPVMQGSAQRQRDVVLPAPTPQQARGRIVMATVTAYCPCQKCCGEFSDGVTSRGRDARSTRGVAVDPKVIPYGSMVTIPGVGTFEADDTGGAMRQATRRGEVHIDLRFNNHQEALNFGRRNVEIEIK